MLQYNIAMLLQKATFSQKGTGMVLRSSKRNRNSLPVCSDSTRALTIAL